MSDNFGVIPTQETGYTQTSDSVGTVDESQLLDGVLQLPKTAGFGKLAAVLLPPYEPETDLLYLGVQTDDPETAIDESRSMPLEKWAKDSRPSFVNMGGNRLCVIGQQLWFDASTSQGNNDSMPTSAAWDFDDGTTATGLIVRHSWDTAGTYRISCTIDGTWTGYRYVRVLADLGESDLDIMQVQNFSASETTGWNANFLVSNDASEIRNYSGILLYVYDDTDLSWRESYEAKLRDLARRTAYSGEAAPEPIWDVTTVNTSGTSATGTSLGLASVPPVGDPTGDIWEQLNSYDSSFVSAAASTGVPANLIKAVAYQESAGNASMQTATGNTACPTAYGLLQVAPGCAHGTMPSADSMLLDPEINILAGAQELAYWYRTCGSFTGAIYGFFGGECAASELVDSEGLFDEEYVLSVQMLWKEADTAIPPVGGGVTGPIYGEVVFNGYIHDVGVQTVANTDFIQVNCVGTGQVLAEVTMRKEAFFEREDQMSYGGTLMYQPMRTSHCIHHILSEHTNFPDRHDVILDWSGPRMAMTTANEGPIWSAFTAWAGNDFASVRSDRHGSLRYSPKPNYRGKEWYDEAVKYAVRVDPTLIRDIDVKELRLGNRVTYVQLCGMTSDGMCELCGRYPCDGPRVGNAGQWVIQRGFQYDDYTVLCAMAAHHYAFLNRRWDARITMPWRHDLDVHDLITMPIRDKSGRFDWTGTNPPVFVVTSISHEYDTAQASWMSTVEVQELTYGIPCDCPRPHCPRTTTTTGGGGTGTTTGGCTPILNEDSWQHAQYDWFTASPSIYYSTISGVPNGFNDVYFTGCDYSLGADGDPRASEFRSRTILTGEAIQENNDPGGSSYDPFYEGSDLGVLSASLYLNHTRLLNGSGTTSSAFRDARYVDIISQGTAGTTLVGTVTLTPRDGEQWGYGDAFIYLFDLEGGSTPAASEGDGDAPFGIDDPRLESYPLDVFDYPATLLGRVASTGPAAGVPITVSLALPASPDGHTYRLGLVLTNGISTTSGYDSYIGELTTTDWFVTGCPYDAIEYQVSPVPPFPTIAVVVCHPSDGSTDCLNAVTQGVTVKSALSLAALRVYEGRDFHEGAEDYFEERTLTKIYPQGQAIDEESADIYCDVVFNWSGCQYGGPGGPMLPPGDGTYPPYDPNFPPGYTCPGWPTAAAINNRIGLSEAANGRTSVIHGSGDDFLGYGRQYGVNPGVVCAILQRESQLACDGSWLPTHFNNFSGITGSGNCGTEFFNDRNWARYCTASAGLEATFALLASDLYRNTGGKFSDIMNLYSPAFENDWPAMWNIFGTVGDQLGIDLNPNTNIYATPDCVEPENPIPAPPSGPGFGGYTTMEEYVCHLVGMFISQGPFGTWSHSICDCYDFCFPIGTTVYPIVAGTVILAGPTSDVYAPNTVVIRTPYGDIRYAHLSAVYVTAGQSVGLDTMIGLSGTAGTGPHLHLGLEGGAGASPVGYSLTNILQAIGFNVNSFPWGG